MTNQYVITSIRQKKMQLLHDRQNIFLAHDHELFAIQLNFGAGVAGEDDFIALLDAEGGAFAGVEALAVPDGEDLAALGLFLGAVGQDDPALGFRFGFHALDEDLVSERTKLGHWILLKVACCQFSVASK